MAQSLALIVHELATNSAKYGALSAGGKLQVRWHADGEIFRFSWVERDGPATKTPTSKGFGIKVINSMVEGQLHGQVNYQWLETGLRCDLAVPLSAQIQDAQAQGASAAPAENGSDREWPILLVEDEVVVGLMMHEMLHDLGFSPTEPFGTVSGALGAVRSKKFSAAILDVNLRGEFVYAVADALLRENTPFVFVTGYAKESIEERFGDIPVLRKPVNRESLHQALRTCLEGARKKNLFEPNRESTNVH
jgi:CheY-like chemotaxis protein